MANESQRHHYIPQFYLKRWAGPDGKLAVFQHRYDAVRGSMKTPAQTGWEWRLYSSVVFDQQDQLERDFMAPVDQIASEVIEIYTTSTSLVELDRRHRDGWSRFLMSLMFRSPVRVADLHARFTETFENTPVEITAEHRAEYEGIRRPDWPATVEDYLEANKERSIEIGAKRMIATLSDNERIGTHLNGMRQVVIRLGDLLADLLTSDQPLIVSGGFGLPDTFCMLPISPRHLFICTNTEEQMDYLKGHINSGRLSQESNASVAMNAEKFVYATSLDALEIVREYFHCQPLRR